MRGEHINAGLVRRLLDYDPNTGIMTWLKRDVEFFPDLRQCNAWNARYAGARAGNLHRSKGYQWVEIKLLKNPYLAHRLAWLHFYGDWPVHQVDHINGDSTDNRISNLRDCDQGVNTKNAAMGSNNTSGVSGVNWNKVAGKWQASVRLNGNRHHLGYFSDITQAKEVVDLFRKENGFTSRHGVKLEDNE